MTTMTKDTLTRIHALAASGSEPAIEAAASVCRYLASDKDIAAKWLGITRAIAKLDNESVAKILAAVESLSGGPGGAEGQTGLTGS